MKESELVLNSNKPIVEIKIKHIGIDDWGRPIFKATDSNSYFGSVTTLFPNKIIAPNRLASEICDYFKSNINELEYFGTKFGCEPHGGLSNNIKLKIVD